MRSHLTFTLHSYLHFHIVPIFKFGIVFRSHSHSRHIQMLFVSNKFIRTHWTIAQFCLHSTVHFTLCIHDIAEWVWGQLLAKCYLTELHKHTTATNTNTTVYSSGHVLMSPIYQQQMKIEERNLWQLLCRYHYSQIVAVANCKMHLDVLHTCTFHHMPVKSNHPRIKFIRRWMKCWKAC